MLKNAPDLCSGAHLFAICQQFFLKNNILIVLFCKKKII